MPNSEYLAARIARSHVPEYRPIVEELLRRSPEPKLRARLLLIRGDLQLAGGDKSGALESYRQVGAAYAGSVEYPAEPVRWPQFLMMAQTPDGAVRESGSHRDNWLIRRFIALEAWPEAEAEFERMWRVHATRRPNESYFALALQFTLDYAFFLKKRNKPDRAVAVLEEQMLRLDLDRLQDYSGLAGAGITAASFLSAAYGEFVEAGREPQLESTIEKDARPAMKRVLAWILLHRGDTAAAIAKEICSFPLMTRTRRFPQLRLTTPIRAMPVIS
jgi:hypothetical protein